MTAASGPTWTVIDLASPLRRKRQARALKNQLSLIQSSLLCQSTGVGGADAASQAAKAQQAAAAEAARISKEQYDQTRADYAPWRNTGSSALDMLARTYGLNGQPADRSAFFTSPGYEFRRDEGLKAVDRGAAARGLLHSGAAVKAEQRFGEGLAASEYDSWWNRLAGVAGVGQAAVGGTAAAGANASNNISQAYTAAGNARASSYANTGSAINSGLNNVLFAYLNGGGGKSGGGSGGGMWGGLYG